jgi:hypothetical protein
MAQAITITLPDNVYTKLKRTAALVNEPLEEVVTQSVAQSLSPLLDDIPAEYQADVYPLLRMNSVELQAEMWRVFPAEGWLEYETLLEQKKEHALTALEQTRLDALRREADVLMFRKGYAAVLLKRRGYHIPAPVDLPRIP